MKKNIYILLFVFFLDIFLIEGSESITNRINKYSYQDVKEVKSLLSKKISEFKVNNKDIEKIINSLKRFDKKNSPKKTVVNGKIKYSYRKLPNEPQKTIEEIERLIKNPKKTKKYEVFIKKGLLTLLSNEIKILIKDLPETSPSGQWIHKDKTLIINKKILKEGTIKFAYLLSHEMIHIAQSCKGGTFDSYPNLLGLELKKPKSFYYKYLDKEIYKDLKKDDMVLEIEAYANQANIAQTLNAFEYFCLKYN